MSAQCVQPFPTYGKGVPTCAVQLYPTHDFLKRIANEALVTYQILSQCIQSFPRYGKGVRTCAHADEDNPFMIFFKCIANGHVTTYVPIFNTIGPAVNSSHQDKHFVTPLMRHTPRAVMCHTYRCHGSSWNRAFKEIYISKDISL